MLCETWVLSRKHSQAFQGLGFGSLAVFSSGLLATKCGTGVCCWRIGFGQPHGSDAFSQHLWPSLVPHVTCGIQKMLFSCSFGRPLMPLLCHDCRALLADHMEAIAVAKIMEFCIGIPVVIHYRTCPCWLFSALGLVDVDGLPTKNPQKNQVQTPCKA